MKYFSRVAAAAGLALAVVLFAQQDVGAIAALVIAAGPGLVLAALFHVVPMLANARGWQRLFPNAQRPALRVVARATWVRESVNGLLPVARIGGEVVAYKIVRSHVSNGSDAAASLVADMAQSMLSQAAFAIVGIALLYAIGTTSTLGTQLVFGIATMMVLGAGFVVAQRINALGPIVGKLNMLLPGRYELAHVQARSFDDALRAVYDRRGDVVACFSWQLAGWLLGAGELWIALRFIGEPRGIVNTIALEALIQAVSSLAFFVPAALGVQEVAFVVIGAALGLDATTALALATARRLRDAIVYFPGLLAWQWAERPTCGVASGTEECRAKRKQKSGRRLIVH